MSLIRELGAQLALQGLLYVQDKHLTQIPIPRKDTSPTIDYRQNWDRTWRNRNFNLVWHGITKMAVQLFQQNALPDFQNPRHQTTEELQGWNLRDITSELVFVQYSSHPLPPFQSWALTLIVLRTDSVAPSS